MADDIPRAIRRAALQNALEHGGKTTDKIVLSKILGSRPDLRGRIQEIAPQVSSTVSDVNALPAGRQRQEIEAEFPDALLPREKRTRQGLPDLPDAIHGNVVTRFPPEPNGYPHIGHAKAAIINAEYARMYEGRCILRIDDTNPEAERMEYHAAIKVGLEWLGVKFDTIKSTSDDMHILHEKALELVRAGKAYVCRCKRDDIGRNRRQRASCRCSMTGTDENLTNWEKMFQKFKPSEAVLRFRGSMQSDNAVMRDPVLFRIIDEKHYTRGTDYRVWPSYDFAVAIEDSLDGITHAFRSKEFEMRQSLIDAILDALDMRKPQQGFFSRLEFKGMPISKRILRPLIEQGKVSWYDDPRLPTLEALKRRGIRPEAIKKFIMSLGLTKSDTLAPFDALESFNRGFVDAASIRLFMVSHPKKILIRGLPSGFVDVPNHPAKDLGTRRIRTDGRLLLPGHDGAELTAGSQVWLMGLGMITITNANGMLEADYVGTAAPRDIKRIQWVPEQDAHKLRILVPKPLFVGEEFNEDSLGRLDVHAEQHYLELAEGSEIQFVRFGYCRKDSQNQAIFTHK